MKILCFEVTYIGFFANSKNAKLKKVQQIYREKGIVDGVKLYRDLFPGTALMDAKKAVEALA